MAAAAAAAGAGGGSDPTMNIHSIIESTHSALPASVMRHIASFVPNWRKMPIFDTFKNKLFHHIEELPDEFTKRVVGGDTGLLFAFLDYLDSEEFAAVRQKYSPGRPAKDRKYIIDKLLCDFLAGTPFAPFKVIVDAGANMNQDLSYPCFEGYPLMFLMHHMHRVYVRDGSLKLRYLVEKGARLNVYHRGEYLIDVALRYNRLDEIVLLINRGVKITNMHAHLDPWYVLGAIVALMTKHDAITEEAYNRLLNAPPNVLQNAVTHLKNTRGIPGEILSNITKPAFKKVRRLIAAGAGNPVNSVATIEALVKNGARSRRKHTLTLLKGGRRKSRNYTRRLQ
jgi:hypothetical protein